MIGSTRLGAALAAAALLACAAHAQTIVRGPYLQLGTQTGVVVRWRTDVPSDSRVAFGAAPNSLTSEVTSAQAVTEHVVMIGGLSPSTRYYYSVGTTVAVLAGGDPDHYFETSPPVGSRKPVRAWVLGDSGMANNESRRVRDAYYAFTGSRHTDLWLMLGDNAYQSGTDVEFQNGLFQNKYEAMLRKSVLWPTFGNHDGQSADSATQTGPYYDIFTLPTTGEAGGIASGTEAYYAFDYANIHFICLDSYDTPNGPGSAMLTWLAADLAATTQEWKIAYWHHPPYSKGSHDSDTESWMVAMRQNVLPVLEAAGIDLVLCGHSHGYERSMMIDGHYGVSTTFGPSHVVDGGDGAIGSGGAYRMTVPWPAPHQGTVYVVAGTSASVVTTAPLDHPIMLQSMAVTGSLVLDVDGDQLDLRFLDRDGAVQDRFTMVKGLATAIERVLPVLPAGASWKRHDLGVDLGFAWTAPAFADGSWPLGPAPLGYGEPYIATTASFGPDPLNKHPTTYFRTTFVPPVDLALMASVRCRVFYDDGFVAHVNGQEVARSPSMPGGAVTYGTFAASHEAGAFELFAVPPSALVPGTNVLAFEVHQTNATSGDLVIDAAMECDAFVPLLGACASGNGGPMGAPADLLLLSGSSGGYARGIDLGTAVPLTLTVMPPPPDTSAHFALFGFIGTPGPQDTFSLPPIGTMCFAPSILAPAPGLLFLASSFFPDPAALIFASPAPWFILLGTGLPPGFTATVQGAVLDGTGSFRLTNAVRLAVVP